MNKSDSIYTSDMAQEFFTFVLVIGCGLVLHQGYHHWLPKRLTVAGKNFMQEFATWYERMSKLEASSTGRRVSHPESLAMGNYCVVLDGTKNILDELLSKMLPDELFGFLSPFLTTEHYHFCLKFGN